MNYIDIIKSYAKTLSTMTETPVVILPSEVKSERFHVRLSILAHPAIVGNGLVRFRLRATVWAEIPPSDNAIDDALRKSIALAEFFDEAQGFRIAENFYGTAYHFPLREDDELFADLSSEDRSYAYTESWLCELEFDNNLIVNG